MTISLRSAALAASLLAAMAPLSASPPQVGQRAPDFRLQSLTGKEVRLADLTADSPVVLLVLRGYPGYQCPICNRQVNEFLSHARSFAEAGAKVVMVYPGPPAQLSQRAQEFTADKSFPDHFTFLLDPDYVFTNLYSLRWDAPRETAYPSAFVLNPGRVVKFAKISSSHGGRASVAEILAALGEK